MRRARLLIALALAVIALALTLAACGGSGDGDEETTTGPPPSESPSGSAAPPSLSALPPEFLQCLEDQGVDLEAASDISAVIHSPVGERCFKQLHGG